MKIVGFKSRDTFSVCKFVGQLQMEKLLSDQAVFVISDWNLLDEEITTSDSLSRLKSNLINCRL